MNIITRSICGSSGFNTASGMDCMQSPMRSTSFARFLFQYRKRYGLHAILSFHTGIRSLRVSIPQAVWIACNFQFPRVSYNAATFQYRKRYGLHAIIGHAPSNEHRSVSIPQAVWIACNFPAEMRLCMRLAFQYRKRYGLHAIFCF